MRFHCHCLNISIDVLKTSDDRETLTEYVPTELVQFVNIHHEWLVGDVATEQCERSVWSSLLQTIPVREMKLNRCLICHLYTHVTNIATNRILINKDLLDEINVQNVYTDPNYSDITKIVLPSNVNNSAMTRLPGALDEAHRQDCESVQQVYRQSLDDAERETEERIRTFQREQEQILKTKTDRLNQELNMFLGLIRSVSRQPSATKISPTSSSYINENSTESGFGSDIFDIGATEAGRPTSVTDRAFSDRPVDSDEETNDDPMLDNRGWDADNSNLSNFAASLPKSIALRSVSSGYPITRQDESMNDLERIGKSFRDLSRSMCTDGTELFGELPSPRLNTRHT